jgi:hypothetical protein
MIPAVRFSSAPLRRLALRAMAGRIGRRGSLRLQRLLGGASESDRRAYDQLVELFRALESGGDRDVPLVAGQRERVLAEVLCSLDAPARPHLRSGVALRLAPLPLLLLVAGLLLAPRWLADEPALQPRGSGALPASGLIGLQAFCVRHGQVAPPPPREDATTPDARCRIDEELQLMITHTAGYPHLLVLGQLDGEPGALAPRELWYYPVPPTGLSGAAPSGRDQALGQSLRLAVNHRPGRVRVVALFSRDPVRAEALFAWLRSVPPEGSVVRLVEQLAGPAGAFAAAEQRVVISGDRQTEVR